MNRRKFIIASAALTTGAYAKSLDLSEALDAGQIHDNGLNDAAVATSRAKRIPNTTIPQPPQQKWHPGQFITHVEVDSKRMAFTFDDGPSPYNTVPILQTLAKYSIKATFYLIGVNVQAWPDIARRIANEGHELGNHSVYHSPYSSSALANQIGPNQLIIKEATGITPVTNRAPGLTKGQAILNACAEHNLYETHTHKDTNDWRSPRRSSPSLINEFKRYDWTGGIALYHDGGSYRPTAQALPIMIQSAIDKGYTFHTVTDLINSGSPRPINGLYPTLVSRQQEDIEESYIDICNYDVKRELGRRLLQLSNEAKKTNIPEINRLKELIGEIDTLEKN